MNPRPLPALLVAVGLATLAGPAHADAIQADCEVRKDGDRQDGKSGPCTFAQRQGFIDIELSNGDTISLSPGNSAGHYRDQNGNKVTRTSANERGLSLSWENGREISVKWSHSGDHGINRLDDGRIEVVWSNPDCIVLIGSDRAIHGTTDECTDEQIDRSREVGQRGD